MVGSLRLLIPLEGLIDLDALVDVDHLVLDSWHAPEHARALAGSVDYWSEQSHDVLSPDERDTLRDARDQLADARVVTYRGRSRG